MAGLSRVAKDGGAERLAGKQGQFDRQGHRRPAAGRCGRGRCRSRWAQLKADTAAKLDDLDAKMDRRADQLAAKVAASQADGAEADAADAIDFAAWTVDNARLAVLDAIDARVYADELATTAGS
jgi:hypothetical protein